MKVLIKLKNIRLFQKLNNLVTEGSLNEETINRFFNLDSENKNLVWAKARDDANYVEAERYPMGYLPLENGNADDYAKKKDALTTVSGAKYRYYKIRTESESPIEGQGWINKAPGLDANDNITYINGFVALESRFVNVSRKENGPVYEGDRISEGEAASGRFFFAARHTEPWIPGRSGTPNPTIYNDSQPQPGHISRMYQEVEIDIATFLDNNAPKNAPDPQKKINQYQITFEASCLRRSLYVERSGDKEILGQPDQGRILLEVYEDDNTTPKWIDPQIDKPGETPKGEGWQPGALVAETFAKSEARINQRNNWFRQTSGMYIIDAESLVEDTNLHEELFSALNFDPNNQDFTKFTTQKLRFRVILEGRHRANWDTDAYFDDVRLKWMFVEKS